MNNAPKITGLGMSFVTAPCAGHCRFCAIGESPVVNLCMGRIVPQVERFAAWSRSRGDGFRFEYSVGRAFNWDVETLREIYRLADECISRPACAEPRTIRLQLGGVYHRSDDELERWLRERQALGVTSLISSLAGTASLHDRWVGRRGDFDFHMRALYLGTAMGFSHYDVLFLTKSTLPLLDDLIDTLDAIPNLDARAIRQIHRSGRAKRMEHERITEQDLEELPDRVVSCFEVARDELKSERQWIDLIEDGYQEPPAELMVSLVLSEANIAAVESGSCGKDLRRSGEPAATRLRA